MDQKPSQLNKAFVEKVLGVQAAQNVRELPCGGIDGLFTPDQLITLFEAFTKLEGEETNKPATDK
jgi:hypothetical protein